MKKLRTNDGSYTFLDSEVKEVYNPLTGAVERAFNVYINNIDFSSYKRIKILDIGFGLGYNSLCIINKCLHKDINVDIFAVEKSINVVNNIKNLEVDDYLKESFNILLNCAKSRIFKSDNVNFTLYVDDAVNVVKELKEKFDVVILDPFSYSNNSELYEKEFLLGLKGLLTDEKGYLICYNSNPVFINNLIENGFYVKKFMVSNYEYGVMASPFIEFKLEEKDKKLASAFGSFI